MNEPRAASRRAGATRSGETLRRLSAYLIVAFLLAAAISLALGGGGAAACAAPPLGYVRPLLTTSNLIIIAAGTFAGLVTAYWALAPGQIRWRLVRLAVVPVTTAAAMLLTLPLLPFSCS